MITLQMPDQKMIILNSVLDLLLSMVIVIDISDKLAIAIVAKHMNIILRFQWDVNA